MPVPTRLVNVVAIQRGTERPNEVVIVQGHIDSRVSDVMDATSDAPGANDDGSGSALVIEAARIISQQPQHQATIVFALLSGEEQGLLGGKIQGIDPGSGLMQASEKALKTYDLKGVQLVSASDAAMLAAFCEQGAVLADSKLTLFDTIDEAIERHFSQSLQPA